MKKSYSVLIASLILALSGSHAGAVPVPQQVPAQAQTQPGVAVPDQNQNILFRTKNYVAQIIWRRGIPFMSVSNNGWRVLSDVRAEVLPQRGIADNWTTYIAVSGDYMAYVRVSTTGEAAIEVTLGGSTVREEYAIASFPPLKPPKVTQQAATSQRPTTVLAFETLEYAVHIFQQQGTLRLNLYNRKAGKTELKQVPVTRINTSDGVVYRYDGKSTVQAREDVQGRQILLIIRDNAIQYRGEAL